MSTVIRLKGCLRDAYYRPLRTAPRILPFDKLRGALSARDVQSYCIPEYTPISDQGLAGTCVANALCDGLEMLLGLEAVEQRTVQLSRRHLYWVARVTHGATDVDAGTYLHAAAWQLQEVGVCEEKYFPYSDRERDLIVSPPLSTYNMASANRVSHHVRLVTRGKALGDDVAHSVRADHPVAFGTLVYPSFMKHRGDSVYGTPAQERAEGRHAMLVVGVRYNGGQREFLLRNSWGKRWGREGHAWVTEEFITRRDSSDFWTLTRMQKVQ
jgi:C1A family cysteine protease